MCAKSKKRVQEVEISEFKAKCSSLVDRVNKTKRPLVITRKGVPVVQVIPATRERPRSWLGSMAGTVKITGDIVSPVIDLDDIEALKD
jgi:prevent-host-death family protein